MRRFICLFLVIFIAFFVPFSASANSGVDGDVDDYSQYMGDYISSSVGIIQNFVKGNSHPDEFFNQLKNNLAPAYWNEIYGAAHEVYDTYNTITPEGYFPVQDFIVDQAMEDFDLVVGSKYHATLVNRNMLRAIDEASKTYVDNTVTVNAVTDYNISIVDEILFDLTAIPTLPYNAGSTTSYNDFVVTGSYHIPYNFDTTKVHVYQGGAAAPAIFLPPNKTINFCNETYSNRDGLFMIFLSPTVCLTSGTQGIMDNSNPVWGFMPWFRNTSGNISGYEFHNVMLCKNPPAEGRVNFGGYSYKFTGGLVVCGESENINLDSYDGTKDYTYIQLMQNNAHTYIDFSGTGKASPETYLPNNINYDSHDQTIVITRNGDDFNGDNTYNNYDPTFVTYMTPQEYTNYINNGNIIQGDYVNDYSQSTVNNIVDSYNTYITNNNTTNNYTFDDSAILGKLNDIIDWLQKIYNKVNLLGTSQELDNIFSDDPIYVDFSDCIVENLPLINDVSDLINNLNVENSDNGSTEIGTYQAQGNSTVENLYNGFTLDLTWYSPYRERIRNLLKIPCWILGIVGVWIAVKSVFGIHSGGGGE